MGTITGVEIVLEERAEIDLFEGIFLFGRGDRIFFGGGCSGAVAVFFFLADVIEERDRLFQLFENRVLDHLSVDHVLELKLVEREDRDHLHQARSEDLALGELYTEFVLQQNHVFGRFFLLLLCHSERSEESAVCTRPRQIPHG